MGSGVGKVLALSIVAKLVPKANTVASLAFCGKSLTSASHWDWETANQAASEKVPLASYLAIVDFFSHGIHLTVTFSTPRSRYLRLCSSSR